MSRWPFVLAASCVLAATLGMAAQQASPPRTVTVSVAVTTSDSRRNIAVLSKGEPPFLFCIDLAAPLAAADHLHRGGAGRL